MAYMDPVTGELKHMSPSPWFYIIPLASLVVFLGLSYFLYRKYKLRKLYLALMLIISFVLAFVVSVLIESYFTYL